MIDDYTIPQTIFVNQFSVFGLIGGKFLNLGFHILFLGIYCSFSWLVIYSTIDLGNLFESLKTLDNWFRVFGYTFSNGELVVRGFLPIWDEVIAEWS